MTASHERSVKIPRVLTRGASLFYVLFILTDFFNLKKGKREKIGSVLQAQSHLFSWVHL